MSQLSIQSTVSTIGMESDFMMQDVEPIIEDFISTPLIFPSFLTEFNPDFHQGFHVPNVADLNHPVQLRFSSLPVLFDEEEYLLSLSFVSLIGSSCLSDYSTSSPVHRIPRISDRLRNVLCYHSCFLTANTQIFDKPPTFQERLAHAEKYSINTTPIVVVECLDPENVFGNCDEIRTLILHARNMYTTGFLWRALPEMGKAYNISIKCGLFDTIFPKTGKRRNRIFTDIFHDNFRPKSNISEHERAEQMNVLYLLMEADVYVGLSGSPLVVEDCYLPELEPIENRRYFRPTIQFNAMNGRKSYETIWDNTKYVSNLKQLAQIVEVIPDCPEYVMQKIQTLIFYRKILMHWKNLRYVDANCTNTGHLQLHNYYLSDPNTVNSPIPCLIPFITLKRMDYPPFFGILSAEQFELLKLQLVFFAILHYTNAYNHSCTKFSLVPKGEEIYTSSDIIFGIAMALDYIIEVVDRPLVPVNFVQPTDPSDDLPSPVFHSITSALVIYLIASYSLDVFGQTKNSRHYQVVLNVVKSRYMPWLKRIAKLWPWVGVGMVARLEHRLKTLGS